MTEQELDIPSGTKAPIRFADLSAGLKSPPFKNRTDSELSYNLQLEPINWQLRSCYWVGKGTNFAVQAGRAPPTSLPVTMESSPVKTGLTGPGPKVRSVWMAWAL